MRRAWPGDPGANPKELPRLEDLNNNRNNVVLDYKSGCKVNTHDSILM